MGLWNLYFLAKIYLFHTGQMQPIWLLNLVFALLLVIPLESRILRVLRQIAIGAGAALAWRESTLPPFARCSQVSNITFTPDTWWSYSSASCRWRWWWPWCWWSWSLLINRWIRTTTFVLLALIAMPIWYGTGITLPRRRLSKPAQSDGSPRGYQRHQQLRRHPGRVPPAEASAAFALHRNA
jgi:hypothetical protein